jgi:hypothetical protein
MNPLLADKPLAELKAIRAHLLRQLRRVGPELVEGSLAVIRVTCGSPGCHCAKGQKHEKHILTGKVAGRTRSLYIPQELVEDVRRWNEEYKRAKQLLKDIAEVNEAIIRGHGRRRRQAAAGLRLVGDEV